MSDTKSLDSPQSVDPADSTAARPPQDDTSDSDDQFSDARSGLDTPHFRPPTPTASSAAIQKVPRGDELSQDDGDDVTGQPNTDEKHGTLQEHEAETQAGEDSEDASDGFGDDFDDFEEGGGGDDGFNDFDDDDFAQPDPAVLPEKQTPLAPQHKPLPFPIPDFDGLSPDEVVAATEDLINILYPPEMLDVPSSREPPNDSSVFINPRSASLWSQLVAPPPLAPPDWIRSRTRRLFLVSLGVPVDLDEILPASKQKKLILPSLNLASSSPPRASSDALGSGVSRLRQGDGNASSTSLDSQGKPSGSTKQRRGQPAQPDLDLVAARYLCNTTDEALGGMTDEELKAHVGKLEAMQGAAQDVLEYWKKRTDEKLGDREAFEGVIENLVKHARKVRK